MPAIGSTADIIVHASRGSGEQPYVVRFCIRAPDGGGEAGVAEERRNLPSGPQCYGLRLTIYA